MKFNLVFYRFDSGNWLHFQFGYIFGWFLHHSRRYTIYYMYFGQVVHSHSSAQEANTELERNSCEDRERPQLIQSENVEKGRVTLKVETARAMVLFYGKTSRSGRKD